MITTSADARAPHTVPSRPVVLVVEDKFLVRVVKVDILRDAGLRVLEAQHADEALDMLRRRPEIIAVLTDVDMPGSLNGFEFAQLVKQGWPELAVLVISGKMEPGPGDLPRGVAFVQKCDPACGARGAYPSSVACFLKTSMRERMAHRFPEPQAQRLHGRGAHCFRVLWRGNRSPLRGSNRQRNLRRRLGRELLR